MNFQFVSHFNPCNSLTSLFHSLLLLVLANPRTAFNIYIS